MSDVKKKAGAGGTMTLLDDLLRGKWSTNGNGNVVDANGELVVGVPRPKGRGASAVRDARARAIAEIPELIEHARWVTRLYGTDDPVGVEDLRSSIRQLRAAIARAEGR